MSNGFYSEVNLKIKQALPQSAKLVTPVDISQLQGTIKSEQPNNRLYNYDGTVTLSVDEVGRTRDFALDPTQLLLRGAQLRNTSWIYGIVVFTGHETKLMLNSRWVYGPVKVVFACIETWRVQYSKKPSKVSNVTRITNRNILYLFTILVAMSIACSIGGLVITVSTHNLGIIFVQLWILIDLSLDHKRQRVVLLVSQWRFTR